MSNAILRLTVGRARRVGRALLLVLSAVGVAVPASHFISEHIAVRLPPDSFRVVKEWPPRLGERDNDAAGRRALIVLFGDYACPACKSAWEELTSLGRRYPRLEIEWRHAPILGFASYGAAVAAECARTTLEFDAVHHAILDDPSRLVPLASASEIGLAAGVSDTSSYDACIASGDGTLAVRSDMDMARLLGIELVPSILVDTVLIRGKPERRYLERYVRQEIE